MSWRKRYDGVEPQRVNKWLANEGVCSRREAEALIALGLVTIDGARIDDPGRKVEPGQTIEVEQMHALPRFSIVLNKPIGIVSAQPESGQIPAARLLTRANLYAGAMASSRREKAGAMPAVRIPSKHTSLAPLGRLDQDSRGLLLLSEDGVLARAVIGPDSQLDKEYLVAVIGSISEKKLALLRHGLVLDGRQLKPALVSPAGEQRLRFVLREGRNRQIRRMCEAVDLAVTDLQRIRIGPLELGTLPEGKWRPLAANERAALLGER